MMFVFFYMVNDDGFFIWLMIVFKWLMIVFYMVNDGFYMVNDDVFFLYG